MTTSDSSGNIPPLTIIDTCVIMHYFTLAMFLRLHSHGLCQPIWSEEIGREWRRNAASIWKKPQEFIDSEWMRFNEICPSANLGELNISEQIYTKALRSTDPKDRHVALASIVAQKRFNQNCSVLITWNLRDFSRSNLRDNRVILNTPDELLTAYFEKYPDLVFQLVKEGLEERDFLELPKLTRDQLLKREGLKRLNRRINSSYN